MFPVEIASDLSYAQLWLLHWLQTYDWAFSLPYSEAPSEQVIEDDEKFDAWFSSYIAKQRGNASSGYSPSRKTASSHKNVIKF